MSKSGSGYYDKIINIEVGMRLKIHKYLYHII